MRFIGSLRIACLALALFGSAPALPQVTAERVQPRIVDIAAHVSEASRRFGIPEAWIYAVMRTESAGRIGAVSSAGAMGLMQLMPGTWARQRARFDLGADPFDPRDNIMAGTSYLREMYDRYGAYPPPFDDGNDAEEQLPRKMEIDVYERTVRGQDYVFQRSRGVYVGDRLTDNAIEQDDYRFHDVFHYAYVAVLGWSPVIRALLRLKRKSDPKLDEAEDGARAILIEEGVTSWLFGQAQQLNFFEGVKRGGLPLDMLKHVRQFVAGYEADRCPLWLWEEAILQGYAAFRFLQKNRRARIGIDFAHRRLRIKELPL